MGILTRVLPLLMRNCYQYFCYRGIIICAMNVPIRRDNLRGADDKTLWL